MKIRLTISDDNNTIISRYFIKNAVSITQIANYLKGPFVSNKILLVNGLLVEKSCRYYRGMLDYNMDIASCMHHSMDVDCVLVPINTMPPADYHLSVKVQDNKVLLSVIKLENKGDTPLYLGPIRNFNENKMLKV